MIRRLALLLVVAAASWFYVTAAAEHGRRVNLSKARADQSGYLMDAENIYHNWHGRKPRVLIGERNRMPLYTGYLALFYHKGLSDPDYFDVAKQANIYLSLGLLYILAVVLWTQLPPLPAVNLAALAAFGIFIYKAAYSQSELLFTFFMFLTFLGCWHLLQYAGLPGWRLLRLAALTGLAAGLAHFTKAALPPYLALFLAVLSAKAVADSRGGRGRVVFDWHGLVWRGAAIAVFVAAFLAPLSPYLMTNKRVFGQYFYNVNSNFYVWYDDWASASVGTRLHGDGQHWPDLPASEIPSAARYWREHSVRQIAERIESGFENMAIVSYRTYDYLPFVILYGGAALWVGMRHRTAVAAIIRDHVWLCGFLAAYAALYLVAIAFYFPISGTGTARFLIPHLLPLFFALSRLLSSQRFRGLVPFHLLMTVVLTLDVCLRTHTRLMATYGGF